MHLSFLQFWTYSICKTWNSICEWRKIVLCERTVSLMLPLVQERCTFSLCLSCQTKHTTYWIHLIFCSHFVKFWINFITKELSYCTIIYIQDMRVLFKEKHERVEIPINYWLSSVGFNNRHFREMCLSVKAWTETRHQVE